MTLPSCTLPNSPGDAPGTPNGWPRTPIESAVAEVFGIASGELARVTRGRARVAFARQVAMYLAHISCGLSMREVGSIFARDRTTVRHACTVVEDRRYTVDKIRGGLLPQVTLDASYSNRFDELSNIDESEVGRVTGNLTVPLYEGGLIYAQVRQAKQLHVESLQKIEQARSETEADIVRAWSELLGARAQVESDLVSVEANQTALNGVREEERVGQRTVLDVLDAERELVNAEVQLAFTRRNVVVASYDLLQAVGRLDVLNLDVSSTVYDPEAHYEEVRRKWIGLTTITHEDGRQEQLSQTVDHEPAK